MRPQLEAAGYRLVVISLGTPEPGGRTFCEALPFPPDLLYLDPDMKVYKALSLYAGLNYFFSSATMEAFKKKDMENFKGTLSRYKFIKPPNTEITLQLGGAYVVEGENLLFAHMDMGIGAHADNADILQACCTA